MQSETHFYEGVQLQLCAEHELCSTKTRQFFVSFEFLLISTFCSLWPPFPSLSPSTAPTFVCTRNIPFLSLPPMRPRPARVEKKLSPTFASSSLPLLPSLPSSCASPARQKYIRLCQQLNWFFSAALSFLSGPVLMFVHYAN